MVSAGAIVTLVLFVLSGSIPCVLVHLFPIQTSWLHPATTPIVSILILWAAQCLNPTVIRNGIVGTEGVKPYNVIILFFSLAYMVITLERSGALRAAAHWVSNKGGNKGWKLYLYFYILVTVASILLGHDLVILSGTTFFNYYTQVADDDRLAWVMTEFAAANTASMVLFVGNPTNVVICEGFSINNAGFTAYTILPFLACSIFCCVALAFQYRKHIPRELVPTPHPGSQEALRDPVAACVGSCMPVATLILCLVVGFFGIDVWMISLPLAILKFQFDCGRDFYRTACRTLTEPIGPEEVGGGSNRVSTSEGAEDPRLASSTSHITGPEPGPSNPTPGPSTGEQDAPTAGGAQPSHIQDSSGKFDVTISCIKVESLTGSNNPALGGAPGDDTEGVQAPTHRDNSQRDDHGTTSVSSQDLQAWLFNRFPTVKAAFSELPIGLLLFVFSQFILIEALNHQGWVNIFGGWLVRASHKQVHPTVWLIGVLGVVLCNISGTSIGATILLTKVVRAAALPYEANRAAAIALAVASNVGAMNFTFSASLTGLLWQSVLERKGIHVKQRTFAFWNLLPVLVLTTVGLGVVSAEMAVLVSL